MTQETIAIGAANAQLGDDLFTAFTKTNSNFTELYANLSAQPQNVIVINEEADFPTQDATTITLDANTRFFIGSQFSTAKSFTALSGAEMSSIGPYALSLIYTGTGVMFNSASANWQINNLGFSCANGTIFGCSGTLNIFNLFNSLCSSCVNIGSFNGVSVGVTNAGFFGVTGQGFSLSGSINTFSIIRLLQVSTSSSHVAVDLGAASIDNLEINNFEPEAPCRICSNKGLNQ